MKIKLLRWVMFLFMDWLWEDDNTIRRGQAGQVCFSRHAICYWSQTHYYFHCICIFWIARLRVKGLSYVPPEQKEALIVDKAVRPRDVQHGAAEDNVNVEGIINLSTLHLFIYLPTQTSLMHVNPPLTHTCFWSVSLKDSVWIGPEGNVDGDEACFNLEQRRRKDPDQHVGQHEPLCSRE